MIICRLLGVIFKMLTNLLKKVTGFGTTKMVLVVRTDLKMGSGKIASQCAHAAISLYDTALKSGNSAVLHHWLSHGQPKIVLRVDKDCENSLKKLYENAKNTGLNACLVHDAGRTQIENGSMTVLGIGPNLSDDVDKITSNLKLL